MSRWHSERVVLDLDGGFYPRESLESAARVLEEEISVVLSVKGRWFRASLQAKHGQSSARLRRLTGEFLNEALSHRLRQEVIRLNRRSTSPVLAAALSSRFNVEPADPLEEMEPQVVSDRLAEKRELLRKAGA